MRQFWSFIWYSVIVLRDLSCLRVKALFYSYCSNSIAGNKRVYLYIGGRNKGNETDLRLFQHIRRLFRDLKGIVKNNLGHKDKIRCPVSILRLPPGTLVVIRLNNLSCSVGFEEKRSLNAFLAAILHFVPKN